MLSIPDPPTPRLGSGGMVGRGGGAGFVVCQVPAPPGGRGRLRPQYGVIASSRRGSPESRLLPGRRGLWWIGQTRGGGFGHGGGLAPSDEGSPYGHVKPRQRQDERVRAAGHRRTRPGARCGPSTQRSFHGAAEYGAARPCGGRHRTVSVHHSWVCAPCRFRLSPAARHEDGTAFSTCSGRAGLSRSMVMPPHKEVP